MSTILITGGSGLIGTAVTKALVARSDRVRHLSRSIQRMKGGVTTYKWSVADGTVDPAALEGVDHVVHLAGAGIADKRWSERRVKELIDSRAASIRVLQRAMMANQVRPGTLVSAAGINYYGAVTSDRVFTESDPPGQDTIGRISWEWEAAVDEWLGTSRVVKLRTPIVLSGAGGALGKLAAPVRYGLGSPLGSGKQWVPWIHLDDLVAIYLKALDDDRMEGAYNVNSGEDVTNAELMRTVAKVLRRPFLLPAVPAALLRLALGELSGILLEGSRASNERLRATGFRFRYPALEQALREALGMA